MTTRMPGQAQTEDSANFDPDRFFEAWKKGELQAPSDNKFRECIIQAFGLPIEDDYGYRATAEVTLAQVQTHINFGARNGLQRWYADENGVERVPLPTAADIAAYTDIFRPSSSTAKALNGLLSNAKKDSIRMDVAKHLLTLYEPPTAESGLVAGKNKAHVNPYFDVWAWSNQSLRWAGPESGTVRVRQSHAILPVLYHHFGCVCPSYEALTFIAQLAKGRSVIDMGSGNGYWSYMLRCIESGKKALKVVPVDSGMSEWRTVWIGNTIPMDGVQWLKKNDGGKDGVLLLVYPNTGEDFTAKIIKAYRGTTIIAASSQNASGFTAFAKETMAQWMAREMPGWTKILQVPLPSFAGKDEALFAFEKTT